MSSSTSNSDPAVEHLARHASPLYLPGFAVTSLVGLMAVAAVNVTVDPYRIYRVTDNTRFDGYRTTLDARTAKAEALVHGDDAGPWQGLILGVSRSEFSVNPEHPSFNGARVFNGSLLGCDMYEANAVFRTAIAHNDIRTIVFFCEFYMFNQNEHGHADFFKSRFYPGRNPILYHVEAMTSLPSLKASLDTVRRARRKNPGETFENGFRPRELSIEDWSHGRKFEAELSRFVKKGSTYRTYRYADSTPADSLPPFNAAQLNQDETDYRDMLRSLIRTCRERHIELHLVISPTHAALLEAKSEVGVWPVYEQWRRDLVSILADDAAAHPQQAPFPLWDFAGFGGIHAEPVADGSQPSSMTYWWEVSHYKQVVGDAILSQVLGPEPDAAPLGLVGVQLTSENVEARIADLRAQREDWLTSHPDQADWVKMVIQKQETARHARNPGKEW